MSLKQVTLVVVNQRYPQKLATDVENVRVRAKDVTKQLR